MRRVVNSRFMLTGNEHHRLCGLAAFAKFIPIGKLRGGPGARCLFTLSVLHYGGYWLYFLQARYGHRLGRVRHLLTKVRRWKT